MPAVQPQDNVTQCKTKSYRPSARPAPRKAVHTAPRIPSAQPMPVAPPAREPGLSSNCGHTVSASKGNGRIVRAAAYRIIALLSWLSTIKTQEKRKDRPDATPDGRAAGPLDRRGREPATQSARRSRHGQTQAPETTGRHRKSHRQRDPPSAKRYLISQGRTPLFDHGKLGLGILLPQSPTAI